MVITGIEDDQQITFTLKGQPVGIIYGGLPDSMSAFHLMDPQPRTFRIFVEFGDGPHNRVAHLRRFLVESPAELPIQDEGQAFSPRLYASTSG